VGTTLVGSHNVADTRGAPLPGAVRKTTALGTYSAFDLDYCLEVREAVRHLGVL
jgi:hypothetical protein